MKKILFYAMTAASALLCSCELFELDNYDGPGETIRGAVVDAATGNPVLTDQGSEGIRVRMTELSWGDNVEHNPDFFCRPDGTFQNTKVFKGRYNVRVDARHRHDPNLNDWLHRSLQRRPCQRIRRDDHDPERFPGEFQDDYGRNDFSVSAHLTTLRFYCFQTRNHKRLGLSGTKQSTP